MIVDNEIVLFQPGYTTLNSVCLNSICNCPKMSLNYYFTDISASVGTIVGQWSNIVHLTLKKVKEIDRVSEIDPTDLPWMSSKISLGSFVDSFYLL